VSCYTPTCLQIIRKSFQGVKKHGPFTPGCLDGAKDSFQSSNLKEKKIYIWLRFCDIILESFCVSRIVKISSFPIKECAVLNSPIRMMVNASENVIKGARFLNRTSNKWSNETVASASCLPPFLFFLSFQARIRKSTYILCFSVHVLRLFGLPYQLA